MRLATARQYSVALPLYVSSGICVLVLGLATAVKVTVSLVPSGCTHVSVSVVPAASFVTEPTTMKSLAPFAAYRFPSSSVDRKRNSTGLRAKVSDMGCVSRVSIYQ